MTARRALVFAAAVAAMLTGGQAAPPEPRLVVLYVEAAPAKAAGVAKALQAYARETRAAGAAAAEALTENGRPSRMAVVEQWPDLTAAEAGRRAKALQGRLGAELQAPIDDRLGEPIVPPDLRPAPAGAFHVLMHIDVVPDGALMARQALIAQRGSVMIAPGALAFEAAAQTGRPNHFAVHEAWKSRAAYEAYAASPAGRALRETFTPFRGAPFDDRFYAPE